MSGQEGYHTRNRGNRRPPLFARNRGRGSRQAPPPFRHFPRPQLMLNGPRPNFFNNASFLGPDNNFLNARFDNNFLNPRFVQPMVSSLNPEAPGFQAQLGLSLEGGHPDLRPEADRPAPAFSGSIASQNLNVQRQFNPFNPFNEASVIENPRRAPLNVSISQNDPVDFNVYPQDANPFAFCEDGVPLNNDFSYQNPVSSAYDHAQAASPIVEYPSSEASADGALDGLARQLQSLTTTVVNEMQLLKREIPSIVNSQIDQRTSRSGSVFPVNANNECSDRNMFNGGSRFKAPSDSARTYRSGSPQRFRSIPKFNGDLDPVHPCYFLEKVEMYYENHPASDRQKLSDLDSLFTEEASVWFMSNKDSFFSFDHFQYEFLGYFWNQALQSQTRSAIYLPPPFDSASGGYAKYFMKNIQSAKYLDEPMSESAMVAAVLEHCPQQVQFSVSKPEDFTVKNVVQRLQHYDRLLAARKPKVQPAGQAAPRQQSGPLFARGGANRGQYQVKPRNVTSVQVPMLDGTVPPPLMWDSFETINQSNELPEN